MVGDAVVESETQSEEAVKVQLADKPETASSNNEEDGGESSPSDDNGSSTAREYVSFEEHFSETAKVCTAIWGKPKMMDGEDVAVGAVDRASCVK